MGGERSNAPALFEGQRDELHDHRLITIASRCSKRGVQILGPTGATVDDCQTKRLAHGRPEQTGEPTRARHLGGKRAAVPHGKRHRGSLPAPGVDYRKQTDQPSRYLELNVQAQLHPSLSSRRVASSLCSITASARSQPCSSGPERCTRIRHISAARMLSLLDHWGAYPELGNAQNSAVHKLMEAASISTRHHLGDKGLKGCDSANGTGFGP